MTRTTGAASTGPVVVDRILTAPNVITFVRLACLPVFLWLLFVQDQRAAAAWLLGGISATDWVDGYVARRFDQVSEFGKVLDPVADRVLFVVAITAIIIDGSAPLWFSLAVVGREVVFGGLVAFLTLARGMSRFDVTFLGKLATALLMFSFPGFMLGDTDFPGHQAFLVAAWILGIPGLVLSYWTAIAYLPTIREHLRDSRREPAP